jgi:hypothetical protein
MGNKSVILLIPYARIFFVEAFHSPRGIHYLLFSRYERMTLGTDFNLNVLFRRPRIYDAPTYAGNGGFLVFRMDAFFHVFNLPPLENGIAL